MKTKTYTPEEFKNKVIEGLSPKNGDEESTHCNTDYLMEELLISLGYDEGVELIRKSTRWYA